MHRRLPRWVWLGGATLAAVAGMVNAAGLLGLQRHGLSHMTGNASAIGTHAATGEFLIGLHFMAVLASFTLGAAVSGLLIGTSHLKLGRRYGAAMLLESALLAISIPLLADGRLAGDYLVVAACGLQNAMATTFSGAVIRTTHVTGLLTDIGLICGFRLRGQEVDRRKLLLLSSLALGFILGGGIGAAMFLRHGYAAMWLPVLITSIGGTAYLVARHVAASNRASQ